MYHPCAACSLRFATASEREAHIRDEHLRPVDEQGHGQVVRRTPAFDWSSHRTAFSPDIAHR